MRTKTLLIAAAALASTIISSQAQVYSANIVGYSSQTLVGNGNFTLIVNPLSASNAPADILMPSLQSGDSVLIWDTGSQTYAQDYYIGAGANQPGGTGFGNWYDGINVTNAPTISAGQGFFYSTGSGNAETNVFSGAVAVTNSIGLVGNGNFTLVGSTPPIASYADSTNFNLPFESGDSLLIWDTVGQTYNQDYYIGAGFDQPGGTGFGNWYDGVNVTNAPFIQVGQGFFYSTGSGNAEQWHQSLKIN